MDKIRWINLRSYKVFSISKIPNAYLNKVKCISQVSIFVRIREVKFCGHSP